MRHRRGWAARAGYLELADGWERIRAGGAGPFVTQEVLRSPDGTEVTWRSRAHRKRIARSERRWSVWWRPRRRSWWMAILFVLGALCFAVGGFLSQWASTSRPGVGVVFFMGSIFFTSAAYLQYSETVNVEYSVHPRGHARWRPASWEPHRIDWLAAAIQLVGTVFFNISTFTALNHNLTTHQANARVWAPDALGSIAFLVSSELALAEVCHRWMCWRGRSLSWKIVSLNLLGSVAFGASAIASLTEPSTGLPISAHIANAGTTFGGLCFLIGAVLLIPEAAEQERTPTDPSPAA